MLYRNFTQKSEFYMRIHGIFHLNTKKKHIRYRQSYKKCTNNLNNLKCQKYNREGEKVWN